MTAKSAEPDRNARRHPATPSANESRTPLERDRDRLLYSGAFRRLAHITQVVGPYEGYAFHNRLTHVLKVAQVGRRLTQKLVVAHPADVEAFGGLSPDVVEAAALAHDLGHPPFGHVAEKELNVLATEAGLRDGFEGNAQSFRVITQLEIRDGDVSRPGLNLTRATLNGTLKYPWKRDAEQAPKTKWGCYDSESDDFEFARAATQGIKQSREAYLMDWADDIAYSVHDMEDFYRAGRIPLDRLAQFEDEQRDFLQGVFARRTINDEEQRVAYERVAEGLFALFPTEVYEGRRDQKATLRTMASYEIAKFEEATEITKGEIVIDQAIRIEVDLLKQLVWHYVIENPSLATQQHGQRRVIRDLFEIYLKAIENDDLNIFPPLTREELQSHSEPCRLVVDLIASYTEKQAVDMHQRLTGAVQGGPFAALS